MLGAAGGFARAQASSTQPASGQAGMMSRKEVTGIVANSRKIVSPNGAEELLTIPVNGTKQWLSIRGRDRRNPVLLVLHGGPGSPTMPADYTFQSPWEVYFTGGERDRRNPVLLVLHGGPGSPTMPADYTFQSPWEDYFTVVEWDQRGAGKTYASNDPKALAGTMTVEQMTSDAEEVVRYLQKTYGKKKIFLLGHSGGR